jgi:hypothetical protein
MDDHGHLYVWTHISISALSSRQQKFTCVLLPRNLVWSLHNLDIAFGHVSINSRLYKFQWNVLVPDLGARRLWSPSWLFLSKSFFLFEPQFIHLYNGRIRLDPPPEEHFGNLWGHFLMVTGMGQGSTGFEWVGTRESWHSRVHKESWVNVSLLVIHIWAYGSFWVTVTKYLTEKI